MMKMMNRKLLIPFAAAAVAAVIVVAFALFGRGGSDAPVEEVLFDAPDAEAGESVSRSGGSDGVGEGVGVKGHWELTVLNADDSVAASHEFHNALETGGQFMLAHLLSGEGVPSLHPDFPSGWTIVLSLGGGSGLTGAASMARDDLAVVVSMETVEFAEPAVVNAVRTQSRWCTSAASGFPDPMTCLANVVANFSKTDIDPIPIEIGQRILVTVTISFTSG